MDERTREGLNFLLTVAVVLALAALLSTLVLPSWLHGSVVYVTVVVIAALGVAHGLLDRGVLRAWGLEPLPPKEARKGTDAGEGADADGEPDVAGKTPKERVEARRARE